jgi:hypothetical protein
MSLVPCRACGHKVDTSAEACPGCGATNPGRKLSRQKHDLIVLLIQMVLGAALLFYRRYAGLECGGADHQATDA